jgi:hypothetical protein
MSDMKLPGFRARTRDAMTYDARTIDSTGAFLIGELDRLDPTLHEPLVDFSWSRDVDLREDVTVGDETSSFTNSTFAATGGLKPTGKAWIAKDVNQITGISLDMSKTNTPLTLWGMEVKYTLPELESSMKLGRPIDTQKYDGLQMKWNMDVDEQVYIGDTDLGQYGLINMDAATGMGVTNVANVAAGAAGHTWWASKTPDEILADVNELLTSTWAASGWTVIPTELRIPPAQYGALVASKVSSAGNMSVLKFLEENNLAGQNGRKLNIQPLKWLVGASPGGVIGTVNYFDRMMAYTKDRKRLRFPMTMLQRTPIENRSLYQITTYYCRLGGVEVPYASTIGYRDLL